jgi:hypothetical protein
VEVLAGVAGGGQREQFALQWQPGAQHGGGLHRLVRRPRENRSVGVAAGERERAVGAERGDRTPVPRLGESGPDNLREYGVGGHVVQNHPHIIARAPPGRGLFPADLSPAASGLA